MSNVRSISLLIFVVLITTGQLSYGMSKLPKGNLKALFTLESGISWGKRDNGFGLSLCFTAKNEKAIIKRVIKPFSQNNTSTTYMIYELCKRSKQPSILTLVTMLRAEVKVNNSSSKIEYTFEPRLDLSGKATCSDEISLSPELQQRLISDAQKTIYEKIEEYRKRFGK